MAEVVKGMGDESAMTLQVRPIRWYDLARRTVVADRRTYARNRKENGPLIGRHALRVLAPNLQAPIFVGAPRSGTTFLGTCLARIPRISYHFEPAAAKAARYVYEGGWGAKGADRFYRSVYAWLMRIYLDAELRFAEKTLQNCFVDPFLKDVFSDARFVHIFRYGRDAVLSYSEKPWLRAEQSAAASQTYKPSGYPHGPCPRFWGEPDVVREFETTSGLHRCAWAWRRFTEIVLRVAPALPAERYHELRYEDPIHAPAREAHRLLDSLEGSNPPSRDAFERGRSDSRSRWKARLSDNQLREIESEAGELLCRLGYVG